jgi:hypothetical protein
MSVAVLYTHDAWALGVVTERLHHRRAAASVASNVRARVLTACRRVGKLARLRDAADAEMPAQR